VKNRAAFCSPAFVASVAVLSAACQASATAPQPVAAGYPPPPPTAGTPPGPLVPPASTGAAPPSAFAPVLDVAPSNGTAQPIDPTLAAAAAAILDKVAGSLAPGMSREGAPMAATFQTGQTMEQVIQLASGRCYTVVAAGPTVQAWDFSLLLVANPVPVSPVLAHEVATGSPAALAGSGNCFKWAWPPVTARVVVKVTQGSGIAVAQLYGK
jgi:hypothetical protein